MPAETLYPTYGNPQTLAQIKARSDWKGLDPEMQRRCEAILVGCDGALGFGGGSRSTSAQRAEFIRRHFVDPNGPIVFEGKRWSLRPGFAPLAAPGNSYHEETTKQGKALAVDFTGDVSLLARVGHLYGLVEFSNVNAEPWHAQPMEIPHSRRDYSANYEPLAPWKFPSSNQPPLIIEEDPMQLIQVEGDAAIFLRDGLTVTWCGAHVDEAAISGGFVAAGPPTKVPRLSFKCLELRGPLPDNNVTVAADFAKWSP